MHLNFLEQSVILVRCVALIVASYYLIKITLERLNLYMQNAVVYQTVDEEADRTWFGAALCFGPRISKDTVQLYLAMDNLRKKNYDGWREDLKTYSIKGSPKAKTVDTLKGFRDFYQKRLNWSEDTMYQVGFDIMMIGYMHLGEFKHDFSANEASLISNFDFSTFHYALCINYSYSMRFSDTDEDEAWHKISLNWTQFNWLLGGSRIAEYVDVFIHPEGHFSEFPLLAEHVPFRMDLGTWQRLRGQVEYIKRIRREGNLCIDDDIATKDQYSAVNCLTWCLRRAILRKVKCTIPQLDAYIYNMTKVLYAYTMVPVDKRQAFRSCNYFNASTAHPWMQEFLKLRLCRTQRDFEETFKQAIDVFFPHGEHKYPKDSNCSMECLPRCTEDRTVILTEGVSLQVAGPKNTMFHGVTIHFSNVVSKVTETWIYQLPQLLIDVSGVMSFMLGISLTAMHEWLFSFLEWLQKRREKNEEDWDAYEGYYDDEGNYYDAYGYYDTEGNYYEYDYEDDYGAPGTAGSQYLRVGFSGNASVHT